MQPEGTLSMYLGQSAKICCGCLQSSAMYRYGSFHKMGLPSQKGTPHKCLESSTLFSEKLWRSETVERELPGAVLARSKGPLYWVSVKELKVSYHNRYM